MIEQIGHQSLFGGVDSNSNWYNEIKLKYKEIKMTTALKTEPIPTSIKFLTLYKKGSKFDITAHTCNLAFG